MKKFAVFFATVKSDKEGVEFSKGKKYEIIFEGPTQYLLGIQNEIPVGIGKECENKIYFIVEEED